MPPANRPDNLFSNWFEQKTIVPHKKLLWFCLGFIATFLPLAVGYLTQRGASLAFLIPFFLLLVILFLFSPIPFKEISYENSRWGIFSIIVLGVGFGALTYRYQHGIVWLWYQFLRINAPYKWILVSLFLLGVVLGFFVVRNWSKNQQDFITSLTTVVGAGFVSTILGQLASKPGFFDSVTTFAFYSLGFGLSGTINLIVFALLVAHYSRTESRASRSVINFLYGVDKGKEIDAYFLKNFENDPNYAKAKLVTALNAYREIIRTEFAKKMTIRKKERQAVQITSPPDSAPKPALEYYELLSIKSKGPEIVLSPPVADQNERYEVIFRKLGERDITAEMFRVAISIKWQDNLEYVVAPGQFQKPLPFTGSVAGLASAVKQTIVMDRDQFKKFRSGDYPEGKAPSQTDQPRGLHEVDYLSYVVVPMASNFGKQDETALGVLHLDTKLFACPKDSFPLIYTEVRDSDPNLYLYQVECTRKELDQFAILACNLYEQQDEYIHSLEDFRGVIVPLLELYLKCRIGTP